MEYICDRGPEWLAGRLHSPPLRGKKKKRSDGRSRAAGGSGLGLSIVRNLVQRMGGRIAVSSRPGGGTHFQVELPPDPTRPLEGAGQAFQG